MIDEVRTGTYRSLFHPETLVTGKEDAASNCEYLISINSRISWLYLLYFRCPWSLHYRQGTNRRSDGQDSPPCRQLQGSAGLLCFPLLRWWNWIWFWCSYLGASLNRLREKVETGIQRVPCPNDGQLGG